jgi:hypothetical protein
MSKLSRLEGLVLVLPRIGYRDFCVSDIEKMKRATPSLLWVALVPSDRSRPGVFTEYTKWTIDDEVEGGLAPGELARWRKVNRRIDDWAFTLSVLLSTL